MQTVADRALHPLFTKHTNVGKQYEEGRGASNIPCSCASPHSGLRHDTRRQTRPARARVEAGFSAHQLRLRWSSSNKSGEAAAKRGSSNNAGGAGNQATGDSLPAHHVNGSLIARRPPFPMRRIIRRPPPEAFGLPHYSLPALRRAANEGAFRLDFGICSLDFCILSERHCMHPGRSSPADLSPSLVPFAH